MVQARVFLDLCRQLHAGHAGHVLVQQHHVEVITQVRLGAQQRQGFFARRHCADVEAPGGALLHQHFAAGVVVVHHQHPGALERAVEVGGRVFQAFRVQRQGQPQGAALLRAALDAEFAVHQQDQLAGDDQAQVTAQAGGREEVLTVQFAVQQRIAFGGFHRQAAVLHGNAQARLGAALVEGDDDQHFAFVGFLQGVFQQAQHCLAQARRVAADHPRHLGLDKADQLDVLLLGLGAEDAQAIFDQRIEVELHVVQFDLSGFQLGDIEDFVDQCEQFVTGAVDCLHIVALLYRQRRAQQQLGHAQHAVHGGADFVADLCQELGLGGDFGVAGRQLTAEVEACFDKGALALAQGQAHQQAAEADKAEQGNDQALRRQPREAKQGGQDDQYADVEHHHPRHEQPRRPVAFLPVIRRDKQHAQAGQGHQGVGDEVQRQGVDEQQQQAAQHDQQNVGHQQFVQRVRAQGHEEAIGKHQPARRGQQQSEVGARCLDRVPIFQPWPQQVEQQRQAEHQQQFAGRQPQAAA